MVDKQILIVSTMFFPQPSVGAVRMTEWCRFLPEHRWMPTVLCRSYGHEATPELLAEKVHRAVSVRYLNAVAGAPHASSASNDGRSAFAAQRFFKDHASQWLVPDASIRFWRSSRPKIERHADSVRPDVVLTTSPFHATHDAGLFLAERMDVPWVADFRDPYLIDIRNQPKGLARLRFRSRQRFERAIYERAALVIHAIPLHARWARMAYPFARDRIRTLTNGYPPELAAILQRPAEKRDPRQSIRVIGWPGNGIAMDLARAIRQLVDRGIDVELRFVGRLPDGLDAMHGLLGDRVHATGRLRHDLALKQLASADVLVCLLDEQRSKCVRLSCKLFEYLAAGKPILVVNPSVPDRQLLKREAGVTILQRPVPDEMASALHEALGDDAAPPLEQVERARTAFSRRTQVGQLAEWLDSL